jgi:citrate lyase gamma subunit
MQYTIRSVPPNIDLALRSRAQKFGKSLNEIILETLAKGTGVHNQLVTFDDLDWFIGKKTLDASFHKEIDWLDSVPKEVIL